MGAITGVSVTFLHKRTRKFAAWLNEPNKVEINTTDEFTRTFYTNYVND